MTATLVEVPGYVAGRWQIDPVHSEVSFLVRHMVVAKVRGRFDRFEGEIVAAADPADSTVTVTIDATSIYTGNEQRDGHVRSADFLDVENHPTITYRSTGVRVEDGEFLVDGELTLKGTTLAVPLRLEVNGFGTGVMGDTRSGFSARADINRSDFGVTFNGPLPDGGLMLSEKIQIQIEVAAVLSE